MLYHLIWPGIRNIYPRVPNRIIVIPIPSVVVLPGPWMWHTGCNQLIIIMPAWMRLVLRPSTLWWLLAWCHGWHCPNLTT